MAEFSRRFYVDLIKQVKAESARTLSYFDEKPEAREDIRSIFNVVVKQIELVHAVAQHVPAREPERVSLAVREIEEAIQDLREDHGMKDIEVLSQVRKSLQNRLQELRQEQFPIHSKKRER